MLKKTSLLFATIIVLLAVSCAPVIATPTPAPILTEEPSIPVTGSAVVQSIEMQLLNNPLQVNAILRGQLPDSGCTTISSIDQIRDGNAFKLAVNTVTTNDPAVSCLQVLTPFEQVVPLDVSNLQPGKYTVTANGLEQSFEVPARNNEQLSQVLVDALNARDYEKLKILMEPSFMIAYWRSEGTANTKEQAVEQLQRNLLHPTSPVSVDRNKDLVSLLGVDPATIVGPGVVEVTPVFTYGWGAQGKDEAILFLSKRSDGEPYWHGLLFAKDGFAKPAPVVLTPVIVTPVDTNAYATQVKYVLALQDVRMRSGPGTQFNIIGFVAGGQTAKVTGVNSDRNWWRVICPDNSAGSCWVSAAANLTRPSDGPLPDTTAYPTNVQYVMALRDVNIHKGPGDQFSIIGFVAAGQTAKVTGISADRNWWRVICPDGSTGSCWVTTAPDQTREADLTGKADVQNVEVQVLQTQPIQANAIARGMLPDSGCTTIAGVTQTRNGNTFTIVLTTKKDPNVMCGQMLTPFEYVIPLEVAPLIPGFYIADVNGVEGYFDLPASVTPELPGPAETQSAE